MTCETKWTTLRLCTINVGYTVHYQIYTLHHHWQPMSVSAKRFRKGFQHRVVQVLNCHHPSRHLPHLTSLCLLFHRYIATLTELYGKAPIGNLLHPQILCS